MPVMDGYQMTRALRAEEAASGRARTPVVALTAAALKGEHERALVAGMDDYLIKPVTIPELAACVGKWLPHTRSEHAVASLGSLPVALPQAVGAPEPLDASVLATLTGGSRAMAREVLDDFLATTRSDLAALTAAREGGDTEAVAHEAHKIKGAARLIGAIELGDAAAALETAAKAADWPQLLPLFADVATAADRLRLHVEAAYS
jgi:CheY-like chemotaxis protein